jgi:hypothetical protein
MSTKAREIKQIRTQLPETERRQFTSTHGRRCTNPHMGTATGYCILHEGRMQKVDDAEVQAVAEQLLANNVELQTKDDLNPLTSQLLTLVAQKRISHNDGSLLAHIASVLMQTITPVKRKPIAEQRAEFIESVAEPIRDERRDYIRKVAAHVTPEPPIPGRTDNPYSYPSKWK